MRSEEDLLAAAIRRRASLAASGETTCYRLIHRAADGFPGLAVDRFGDVLVAGLYEDEASVEARPLLARLLTLTNARAVYIKRRPSQASRLGDEARSEHAPATPLLGEAVEETQVLEGGARFAIRPGAGLSVGLFLDMRDMRAWVRSQAKGKSVLNCFAYTCAFGVAAGLGGAGRVVNLDVSRPYLDWGKHNAELNGLSVSDRDYIFGDVFDWLNRFARSRTKFDLVILDPPSFATTKKSRFSVSHDYAGLVKQAAAVTGPGGCILACTNAAELPAASFSAGLRAGLAGRTARLEDFGQEPEIDFPVAAGGRPYLKLQLIRLLD